MTHVYDGGPWRGISTEEQVERIARGSTPVREYVDGKFQPWIERPATRSGQNDLAGGLGTAVSRDDSARSGSPDGPPLPAAPSRPDAKVAAG
jgi:hypothetical protein